MSKRFAVEMLEEVINVTVKRVEGTLPTKRIVKDIEEDFINEVDVVRNNRFRLTYLMDKKETVLETTYSNQEINETFLNELEELRRIKQMVEMQLRVIQKHEEKKQENKAKKEGQENG
jgi:hypothetical protein